MLALALAYARFRQGWRATISGALRPVLGDRADGPLGVVVDTVAVVATVFGVATSLGLGAAQVNGGLAALVDGVEVTSGVQLAIIAVVTVLFLVSAMSGPGPRHQVALDRQRRAGRWPCWCSCSSPPHPAG